MNYFKDSSSIMKDGSNKRTKKPRFNPHGEGASGTTYDYGEAEKAREAVVKSYHELVSSMQIDLSGECPLVQGGSDTVTFAGTYIYLAEKNDPAQQHGSSVENCTPEFKNNTLEENLDILIRDLHYHTGNGFRLQPIRTYMKDNKGSYDTYSQIIDKNEFITSISSREATRIKTLIKSIYTK